MRIVRMTKRMSLAGLLFSASLVPLPTAALMLGEITSHSYLGQVFRATIPLGPVAEDELDSRCFSLGRPARPDEGSYLLQAHLGLEQKNGQAYLSIRSADAINEPYLRLQILADCGHGRVERKFVVLLDPQEPTALQAHPMPGDRMPEQRPEPAAKPRPAVAGRVAKPAAKKPAASSARPRQAQAASGRPPVPPPEPANVASGDFRLRLSSDELDLSMLGKMSEEQRQQLREKQRLLDVDDQVANTLSMKHRIMQLESQLTQLQAELANTNSRLAMSTNLAPPAAARHPEPSTPSRVDSLRALGESISFRSMAGVGLILALLLSVWWRWRRRKAEAWLDAELSQEFPDNASYSIPAPIPTQPGTRQPAASAAATPEPAREEDDFYHAATSIYDPDGESVTFTEAESVLDEADLYLAYGWANRAIELLQEYLRKHPDDVHLWRKLFETYASQDMKQEFEQLALRCQATMDNEDLWALVQKLGHELDRENPLYSGGKAEDQPSSEPEIPTLDTPLEFVLESRETESQENDAGATEDESLQFDPLFPVREAAPEKKA